MSLFSRHTGRHCRYGSLTGWSGMARIRPAAVLLDFTRRRINRPAITPMAAPDHNDQLERSA